MNKKLSPNEFDLFLNFVFRHKRFLKPRETSFSQAQLEDGKKRVGKAVKAVDKKKLKPEELDEMISNPKKRSTIAKEIKKACNCTPRQAQAMAENFRALENAVRQPKPTKIILEPAKNDKFYAPKPHNYR
ncbi:MAG: hypothetical protein ACP5O3_03290 [Candidatus Micrarchaeia archaeon]|jgi:hypothetical protein